MRRNRQLKGGGYAGKQEKQSYASEGKCGGNNKKTVEAAAALGLGLPQQNTVLSGLAGLGMAQYGTAESSGLTFWICRDEDGGKIGWLDYRPTVCE